MASDTIALETKTAEEESAITGIREMNIAEDSEYEAEQEAFEAKDFSAPEVELLAPPRPPAEELPYTAMMSAEMGEEDDLGPVGEEESAEAIRENIQDIIDEKQAEFEKCVKQPTIKLDELSTRDYLQKSVVPIITQGLETLGKERPPEPIEFLAAYLIKNKQHYQKY